MLVHFEAQLRWQNDGTMAAKQLESKLAACFFINAFPGHRKQ